MVHGTKGLPPQSPRHLQMMQDPKHKGNTVNSCCAVWSREQPWEQACTFSIKAQFFFLLNFFDPQLVGSLHSTMKSWIQTANLFSTIWGILFNCFLVYWFFFFKIYFRVRENVHSLVHIPYAYIGYGWTPVGGWEPHVGPPGWQPRWSELPPPRVYLGSLEQQQLWDLNICAPR